ncbi:response regulator transcription factor [Carboxylicivirga mesophila]|uniref:Response regulator transcription factor n=1 Tax=Carboxylicivirga mesophila TaxID=1166478 RepID=A0ABS5K6C8_9BACT|nr:response regulator transcription factor [Carboxylicivirga mesophila]MBS2210506.1 response regulator transcription factor [Carboxylicivirga mesophila]
MKILIVEDEPQLAQSVQQFLSSEGHSCEMVGTLNSALQMLDAQFDIVILDLNLPDGNGLEVVKKVKGGGMQTGIIILSARDSLENKIEGLELGADDYLTKPFQMAELNARLKSLVRRVHFKGEETINFNELEIVPGQLLVKVNDNPVDLTKKEFDLLVYFIANKNRVLTKTGIGEHMSKDFMDYGFTDDLIYSHIKNLRKKLIKAGCGDYIKNVYGVGYKFTDAT